MRCRSCVAGREGIRREWEVEITGNLHLRGLTTGCIRPDSPESPWKDSDLIDRVNFPRRIMPRMQHGGDDAALRATEGRDVRREVERAVSGGEK